MMETGVVARIVYGLGEINAATAPSPVTFDANTFRTVIAGERVNFTRNAIHPDMADWVGRTA
jgi:hypothetical protein